MPFDAQAQNLLDTHITRVKTQSESQIQSAHGDNPTSSQILQGVTDVACAQGITQKSFLRSTLESVPGIAFVAAVMAIVFGVLAYFDSTTRTQWLDIVKIFAGAVVGSAGTAAVRRP